MNTSRNNVITKMLLLMAVVMLSACSSLDKLQGALNDNGNVDYQNNQSIKLLEVPPDLTTPQYDRSFDLPTGTVSAVALKNGSYQSTVRNGVRKDSSTVRKIGSKTVLQVNAAFPRALALTEIMLGRMKFTSIKKSSAGDVLTVKYNGEDVQIKDDKNSSFLTRMLGTITIGADKKKSHFNKALLNGETYVVSIKNENGLPIVRITRANKKSLSNAAHARIINLINTEFNR